MRCHWAITPTYQHLFPLLERNGSRGDNTLCFHNSKNIGKCKTVIHLVLLLYTMHVMSVMLLLKGCIKGHILFSHIHKLGVDGLISCEFAVNYFELTCEKNY